MTQAFKDMLYLFMCAAHGLSPEEKEDYDLEKIFTSAQKQGVWPLVLMSLRSLYKDRTVLIQGRPLNSYVQSLRTTAFNNMQRHFTISNAINQLAENDISCCVLKGNAVAGLYCNSECRISGDTDIYIKGESKIKEAIKILEKHGFVFRKGHRHSNQLTADHKTAGILELHRNILSLSFNRRWLENDMSQPEPYRMVISPFGDKIPTLGVTEGLIYIFFHIAKHFVSGGIGVRPMMDTLLYIRKYKAEINTDRFWEVIRDYNYEKFFEAIMSIGVKYLGFTEAELFPYSCDETMPEKLLTDMEDGGLFGYEEDWRVGFFMAYYKQRFDKSESEEYAEFIKDWKKDNPLLKRVFCSRSVIEQNYPYVAKYKFLLPVGWVHRAIKFIIKSITGNYNKIDYTDDVRKRMDLIRDLDMF